MKRCLLVVTLLNVVTFSYAQDWTWLYRKNFAAHNNTRKTHVFFGKDTVPLFTQLIFSWNVLRPKKGHFSFFVQVRDSQTKKWGQWHHMVDWGADIQKTYMSKSDGVSSYVHVRLELDDKKYADGFRIKIEAVNGASCDVIHNVSVALSHFGLFKPESCDFSSKKMRTVILQDVPAIAQFALDHDEKHRICSPISCAMMVRYMTGQVNNEDLPHFVAGVFDAGLSIYGSWPCNIAQAYESCNGAAHFFVRRLNSFVDIYKQLIAGTPVVVSVRGNLPGALKPFPHGHLMVVIGWDNENRQVVCHDPASEDHDMVLKNYAIEDFIKAWECSHRLAYLVEKTSVVSAKK